MNRVRRRFSDAAPHLSDTIRTANVKVRHDFQNGWSHIYEQCSSWLEEWPDREIIRCRSQRLVGRVSGIDWIGIVPQSWPLWVGVGAVMLFVIGLVWGGAVGSLVTVAGTLGGVALGAWFTGRQRQIEEERKRGLQATILLNELKFLENTLRQFAHPRDPGEKTIETSQTAMYEGAGSNLLLFSHETVQALMAFYQRIYDIRTNLNYINALQRQDQSLFLSNNCQMDAIEALRLIKDLASLLHDEGGEWPRARPMPAVHGASGLNSLMESVSVPPPVFENMIYFELPEDEPPLKTN